MAEIQPIVADVSVGNALVAIDCEDLLCIESVDFRLSQEEVLITCDAADGPVTTLRMSPTAEITVVAMNLSALAISKALDASTTIKAGDETVSCEEHQITWVAEDVATPGEWTATVCMNSPEISTVLAWTDNLCTVAWESATTPLNVLAITDACTGCITLTTNDIDETDDTLWFSYVHNTETPLGATLIKPGFSTFADDHKLHILHRNATNGNLHVMKFWRVQIIPDYSQRFDNTTRVATVTIRMRALADRLNHPNEPIYHEAIIDAADSEAADFTLAFYKRVRAHIG